MMLATSNGADKYGKFPYKKRRSEKVVMNYVNTPWAWAPGPTVLEHQTMLKLSVLLDEDDLDLQCRGRGQRG